MELSPGVDEVDFGSVVVGQRAERGVVLRNSGRYPVKVRVESEAPFALHRELALVAGESIPIAVVFKPESDGAAAGVLFATSDEAQVSSVRLCGRGVMPQTCEPSACQISRLNAESGACEFEAAPDGVTCAAPCLESGTCISGTCVGTARSCDDGDACTADACDPRTGCVHAAVECEAEEPCEAAACDPARGCVAVAVSDGTSCGRRGCDVQDVCISGECVQRPATEGMVCGEPSPCQGLGVCNAGTCVRPQARTLAPAWALEGAPGQYFNFRGLTDRDGNLYLNERLDNSPEEYSLLSLTSAGALRYRIPYAPGDPELPTAVIGDLLLSRAPVGPDLYELRARHVRDGQTAWTTTLAAELEGQGYQPRDSWESPKTFSVTEVHEAAGGTIGALVVGYIPGWDGRPPESVDLFRAKVDPVTGSMLSAVRVANKYGNAIAAADGHYFISDGFWARGFAPDGHPLWTLPANVPYQHVRVTDDAWVVAMRDSTEECAYDGEWALDVIDAATGAVRTVERLTGGQWSGVPLALDGDDLWAIARATHAAPCEDLQPYALYRIDARTGAVVGKTGLELPHETQIVSPELGFTNRNTLFVSSAAYCAACGEWSWYAREFTRDGAPNWACEIDGYHAEYGRGGLALVDGYLIEQVPSVFEWAWRVRGFALPGYAPATRGWSGEHGNAQHTRAARQ